MPECERCTDDLRTEIEQKSEVCSDCYHIVGIRPSKSHYICDHCGMVWVKWEMCICEQCFIEIDVVVLTV